MVLEGIVEAPGVKRRHSCRLGGRFGSPAERGRAEGAIPLGDRRRNGAVEGIVVGRSGGAARQALPPSKKLLDFKKKLAHPKGVEPLTSRFVVGSKRLVDRPRSPPTPLIGPH